MWIFLVQLQYYIHLFISDNVRQVRFNLRMYIYKNKNKEEWECIISNISL